MIAASSRAHVHVFVDILQFRHDRRRSGTDRQGQRTPRGIPGHQIATTTVGHHIATTVVVHTAGTAVAATTTTRRGRGKGRKGTVGRSPLECAKGKGRRRWLGTRIGKQDARIGRGARRRGRILVGHDLDSLHGAAAAGTGRCLDGDGARRGMVRRTGTRLHGSVRQVVRRAV